MKRTLMGLGALFLIVLAAAPAHADEVLVVRPPNYARRHFYLGAEGVASVFLNQTEPHSFVGDGAGFNLFLGGRVTRHLALEFGWQPTFHGAPGDGLDRPAQDGIGLSALTFDVKLYPLTSWVQPYFTVGPGVYVLTDYMLRPIAGGGGYQIGGGIDFYVLPVLSLGLKAQYRGVTLLDYDPQGDTTYLSMLTIAANVTGRF
jgi:hypothetical protein